MNKKVSALAGLHAAIDERVQSIRENCPDWLCSKGCDACCQRLAAVPRLTEAEWELLKESLSALSPDRLSELRRDVMNLTGQRSGPVVCPLLDRLNGACPVYAQRPVACRTYGFYVQRELGLYCPDIELRVAEGGLSDVVWGNQDVIDQALAGFGETRALTDWFANWETDNA